MGQWPPGAPWRCCTSVPPTYDFQSQITLFTFTNDLLDQGQGAGCAIEDAASLAVVLRKGTDSNEVPGRLRLYQDIRIERANRLRNYSRNAGRDIVGLGKENFNSEFYLLL